jgi:hypothetical protein
MTLRKEKILETEIGSTSSDSLQNALWKRLRTYRKTDCAMRERMKEWRIWQSYLKQLQNDIKECFQAWKAHMEQCVASNGNYIEGNNRQI